MISQRPTERPGTRPTDRTVVLAFAGALLVSTIAAWQFWPEPAASVPAAASVNMTSPAPPGVVARAPAPVALVSDDPDTQFELTPDGHLVPNGALLDALNASLATPAGEGWDAALRRRLAARLAPPALDEAMRIAIAYRAYARAHDDLLAAQGLRLPDGAPSPSDLARFSTWRDQRARLRAGMLDQAAVRAWYADDELQLAQAIDELQRSGEPEDAAQVAARAQAAATGGAPYRPAPRFLDKAEAARHQAYLLGVLATSAAPLVGAGPR